MIHWLWLVPAMMLGGTIGVGTMTIMQAIKEDQDEPHDSTVDMSTGR